MSAPFFSPRPVLDLRQPEARNVECPLFSVDQRHRQAILERWPSEEDPADRSTPSRWLKRATQQRLICCAGSGYRGDSFLYWLPGREPLLWPGYNASEEGKQARRDRCAAHARSLRERPASA